MSFVESLMFTAFFATSANIINGYLNAWSQRASIFLVPPALLMLVRRHRMRDGWPKLATAFTAGLVMMLSYVQDFYTAQFTAFFAALMFVAYLAFVLITALLAWVPWLNSDRAARRYALWLFVVSVVVLLVPLAYGGLSLWRVAFAPLPGFKAIRDPARIIYSYELAVGLALALIVSRPLVTPLFRVVIVLTLAVVMLSSQPPAMFGYQRPIPIYRRWVSAPIDIDRTCESFFVKRASAQCSARQEHQWSLYSLDASFIAMRYSLPTLNGYSTWVPERWNIADPNDREYTDNVNRWIDQNRLTNVCELDIDARTMKPYQPGSSISSH